MSTIEVKVPDIGDFKDVPVISVMVKPGDTVAVDDPLIEIESDKATMEVPSPAAGQVQEIRVVEGDRVSQGVLLLLLAGSASIVPACPHADGPQALPRERHSTQARTFGPNQNAVDAGRRGRP